MLMCPIWLVCLYPLADGFAEKEGETADPVRLCSENVQRNALLLAGQQAELFVCPDSRINFSVSCGHRLVPS